MDKPSDNDGIYKTLNRKRDLTGNNRKYCHVLLKHLILAILTTGIPRLAIAQESPGEPSVTIPDTTCTIGEMLNILEGATGLSFSYNSGIIDEKKTVQIKADDENLTGFLSRIINDPALDFKIVGSHLVIYQPRKVVSADPAAQKDSVDFFMIEGKVFDRSNRLPLPYANIYLKNKSIGTISNEEGEFTIKLSSQNLADTLTISYMGYKNHEQEISTLVNTTSDYFLEMDVVPIQEVIIRLLSPVLILENARTNIPFNYPQNPVILTSFYRETVKRANRYMIVSEALLDTYKPGYNNLELLDQVRIIKGRSRQDISRGDTVMLKLKAGLNTMLMLDVIKYMPDFMQQEGLYDYSMSDIVMENDRENYVIDFVPSAPNSEAYYRGRIFIDVNDLSVTRVEFSIDPARLTDATRLFVVRKPVYLNVKVLEANYDVSFRKVDGTYYLHYIKCETGFRVRYRKQLFGSVYSTSLEMAVTHIDTVDVDRFRYREIARTQEVFNEQITGYDEAFWGEFNFIRPDDPLIKALGKLENVSLELLEE